ncbi:MAG: hypothetical protein AAGM36_16275, partial [Cyanobacteria bacterium J06597_1]
MSLCAACVINLSSLSLPPQQSTVESEVRQQLKSLSHMETSSGNLSWMALITSLSPVAGEGA